MRPISYFISTACNFLQKKIVVLFSLFFICVIAITGCKKTENFSPSKINAPLALNVSDSSIILNETNKFNTAITLNWTTGSNYGSNAPITYVLEIDKQGNNFAGALKNNIGKAIYSLSYTTSTLNGLLLSFWKAPVAKAFVLEARMYTASNDSHRGETLTCL